MTFRPEVVWPLCSGAAAENKFGSLASWTAGVLVHPGALISILHLLPAMQSSAFQVRFSSFAYSCHLTSNYHSEYEL